jgi:hypothetical protein
MAAARRDAGRGRRRAQPDGRGGDRQGRRGHRHRAPPPVRGPARRAGGPRGLRRKGNDPAGATVYCTLEPCVHHGKQPPCTDALIEAGSARSCSRARTRPRSRRAGSVLKQAGIPARLSDASPMATRLSDPFIHRVTDGPALGGREVGPDDRRADRDADGGEPVDQRARCLAGGCTACARAWTRSDGARHGRDRRPDAHRPRCAPRADGRAGGSCSTAISTSPMIAPMVRTAATPPPRSSSTRTCSPAGSSRAGASAGSSSAASSSASPSTWTARAGSASTCCSRRSRASTA